MILQGNLSNGRTFSLVLHSLAVKVKNKCNINSIQVPPISRDLFSSPSREITGVEFFEEDRKQ